MAPNLYDVPDYHLVRVDRVGAGGGGVAIYIHDSVNFSIVDQSGYIRLETRIASNLGTRRESKNTHRSDVLFVQGYNER